MFLHPLIWVSFIWIHFLLLKSRISIWLWFIWNNYAELRGKRSIFLRIMSAKSRGCVFLTDWVIYSHCDFRIKKKKEKSFVCFNIFTFILWFGCFRLLGRSQTCKAACLSWQDSSLYLTVNGIVFAKHVRESFIFYECVNIFKDTAVSMLFL